MFDSDIFEGDFGDSKGVSNGFPSAAIEIEIIKFVSDHLLFVYLCMRKADPKKFHTWDDVLEKLQFLCELWDNLKQITDQSIIGNLEDGTILVFVDGHDCSRVFHAGYMLNGTADSDSDLQIWSHNFTSLPDLKIVSCVARIHGRSTSADSCMQLFT